MVLLYLVIHSYLDYNDYSAICKKRKKKFIPSLVSCPCGSLGPLFFAHPATLVTALRYFGIALKLTLYRILRLLVPFLSCSLNIILFIPLLFSPSRPVLSLPTLSHLLLTYPLQGYGPRHSPFPAAFFSFPGSGLSVLLEWLL